MFELATLMCIMYISCSFFVYCFKGNNGLCELSDQTVILMLMINVA